MFKHYTVAILMTCYNRENLTRRCIKSLKRSADKQNIYSVDFYVVDDGSTDGTSKILDEEFPFVIHLHGNGNVFWNGGMYYAFKEAVKKGYDFYLWVNDDVEFYDRTLEKLISLYNSLEEKTCIITGYTYDKNEKVVTYGGQRLKSKIFPLDLHMILPTNKIQKCDSMHGNCVLIHKSVVEVIGIIDNYYTHGFGDVDYGLSATKNGIPIYLSNFAVGKCDKNPNSNRKNTYKNKKLIERFRIMNSWRHRPVKDWLHFTKKFGGKFWFLRFIAPYLKLLINKYE